MLRPPYGLLGNRFLSVCEFSCPTEELEEGQNASVDFLHIYTPGSHKFLHRLKGAPGWRTGHFEVNTGHAILSASEANSSGRLEVLAVH